MAPRSSLALAEVALMLVWGVGVGVTPMDMLITRTQAHVKRGARPHQHPQRLELATRCCSWQILTTTMTTLPLASTWAVKNS